MSIVTKITIVIIRFQVLIFLALALFEWGMIAAGTLLGSFKLISPSSVNFDARFLESVFYLLLSAVLHFRGRSLAIYLTQDLQDETAEFQKTDAV